MCDSMVQPYFEIKAKRERWNRIMFYADLVVLAVLVISEVALVIDAFYAGYWYVNDISRYGTHLWRVARDVAFLVGAMFWIFYRLFTSMAAARRIF